MKKLFAAAVLGLAAFSATADRDFYYEGTLYGASGPLASYKTPLSGIYKPMADAQQVVMSELRSYLVPLLKDSVAGVSGYQSGSATVGGPITITYRNGEVSLSGVQVGISAVIKRTQAGITATCNIALALDPATTLVGRLDVASGQLAPVAIRNFKLNPSYACQTSLDWVPVVNLVVDAAITHFVDKAIEEQMQKAYNKLAEFNQLQPIPFLGLNAIPDAVFGNTGLNLANLKNQIAGGFQNLPEMTVVIGDPKRRVMGPQGYPHMAASHDLVMSISVGSVAFQLGEHRVYYDEMYCPAASTGRACIPF